MQVWLDGQGSDGNDDDAAAGIRGGATDIDARTPPEQLPIMLQMLLSPVCIMCPIVVLVLSLGPVVACIRHCDCAAKQIRGCECVHACRRIS